MCSSIFKSIGQYFTRKSPQIVNSQTPRVVASARLAGVKGNELKRFQLAEDLNNNLFVLIEDVFEQKIKKGKKPTISGKEIVKCLKKLVPNINIKFAKENNPYRPSSVENILDESHKTVVGYLFKLHGKVEKGVNEHILKYAMQHIFNPVVQPKITARKNTHCLMHKLPGYTKLFHNDSHLNSYSKILGQRMVTDSPEKELKLVEKCIKNHFDFVKSSSEEKIEVLQSWRARLKDKLHSFTVSSKFSATDKNSEAYLNENFGTYLLGPKIKLVERLLKEEILTVRQANAAKRTAL